MRSLNNRMLTTYICSVHETYFKHKCNLNQNSLGSFHLLQTQDDYNLKGQNSLFFLLRFLTIIFFFVATTTEKH